MSESQDVEDDAHNVKYPDSDWEYEYDDTETEAELLCDHRYILYLPPNTRAPQIFLVPRSQPCSHAERATAGGGRYTREPRNTNYRPIPHEHTSCPQLKHHRTHKPTKPDPSTRPSHPKPAHILPQPGLHLRLVLHPRHRHLPHPPKHISPPIHHAAALPPQRIRNRYIMHQPHRPGCDRRAQSR
ncbi:MAG: hypothetical protein Q9177_005628 [Variospora cf. flavescens]